MYNIFVHFPKRKILQILNANFKSIKVSLLTYTNNFTFDFKSKFDFVRIIDKLRPHCHSFEQADGSL